MKSCAALILAAGAASRWANGPKVLASWDGRPLIDHVADVARAAGAAPIYRVLGAHREVIEAVVAPSDVSTVFNPRWADGLGASLACGMRALLADPVASDCAGVLILLGDQPLVSGSTLRALRERHERSGHGLVFSSSGEGRRGPPAFVARRFWPELTGLSGEEGARTLAVAHPDQVAIVSAPESAADIDTAEDYARLIRGAD